MNARGLGSTGSLIGKGLAAVAVTAVVLLGQPLVASAAPGPLTITPLGWNIIGLDSNNVNQGPDTFPVGARVCNTGTNAVTNAAVTWTWGSSNTYVSLTGASTFTEASLAAGDCNDYYFNVQVARNTAAYDTARRFTISASGDSVATVSTASPREVYVEHLVSQNRNAVNSWTLTNSPGCNAATGVVNVGATCTATINSKTATGGYAQLVNAYYFNNSIFRIESLSSTYSVPSGYVNTDMHADACGWDNVPTSGTYASCLDTDPITGGNAGGNPIITTVTFTVIGTGSQTLTGIIYDFSGSSFHYNSDAGVTPNLLALTATYADTAPNAVNDTTTTNEDTQVDVNVLSNDSDVNGNLNSSSLSITAQPTNGTASIVGGQVRYLPNSNFNGTDTLTYQICDSTSPTPLCSTATVTITVNAVNDPPIAVDDTDTVNEDATVTVDVLGNDIDVDDGLDPGSVTVLTGPSSGSTSVNPDGSIDYTPDADYFGSDSFTYRVCDFAGSCDTATVDVTVNAVNDPPDAADDTDSVAEDGSVTIDVLTNDTDVDDGLDPSSVTVTVPPANGSIVVNPDGTIDYTPNPDFYGSDSFTYEVCDDTGVCDSATVDVTVTPVNDPPVAVDDSESVNEDASVTVDVLGNDSDVDDGLDPASVTVLTGPSSGSTSVNPDGSIDYTPDPDYFGSDSFTYEVCDLTGACDTATVDITVFDVNEPPVAADDSDTVDEDASVTVDMLGNDTDVDDGLDPASVTVLSGPSNGSTSVNPDGSIDYTPDADFFGSDSFTYQVCDFAGACDSATVDITVDPVNDPPSAADDSDTVDEDASVTVDVLGNDSDIDDGLDPASVTVLSGPSNGSTSVNPDGSIDYAPETDFFGSDSFSYQVCDLAGACDSATVDITVDPVNDPPNAADDVVAADQNSTTTIDVQANDGDIDGDALVTTLTSSPSHGSATVNPDGTVDYTPDTGYLGSDSFTYQVCDPSLECADAVVFITVSDLPEPPDAVDDTATVAEDGSVTVDVLANDSDPEGDIDAISVTVVTPPANGIITVNPDGSIDYDPNPDFTGTDSFVYQVCDSTPVPLGPLCSTATVDLTVTPVNDPPVALNDSDAVDEDSSVTVDVLGNDSDVDDGIDAASVSVTSSPTHGTTSVNPDGTIDYTPDADFAGSDSFSYQVCDFAGACDSATVDITVNDVNDPPVARDDSDTVDEDSSVSVDVLGNDNDIDDGLDPTSVTVIGAPGNGTTSVNPDGSIDYTPDADYFGPDSFPYRVCDFAGACDTATVDITVDAVNDPPSAADDSALVNEDAGPVAVDVMANDSDVDSALDPSSVSVTGGPSNGTASVNPDGTIDYTPDPDFSGTDTFTYQVCDVDGDCASATVTVTVSGVNDPPVAHDDSDSVDEDTSVTIDVLANDDDVDDGVDPASVSVTGGPSHGSTSVNPDGSIDYTPNADFFGSDSFTYQVCDFAGACDTATVDITVDAVNDPPVALDDAAAGIWGVDIDVDILTNDSDSDGAIDDTSVTITSPPSNGTVTVHADGTVTYVADDGFVGVDTFDYRVCDDGSPTECATATVTVTVSANQGPDAVDDTATVDEDDGPITIDVLSNDSDPEGSGLTVTSAGPASNGTVTVNPDGSIDYVPDPDFNGVDSFTYTVCDAVNNCSTATVTVTVNPVNDPPRAVNDSRTVRAGHSVNLHVMSNDDGTDDGLDSASVVVISAPSHGTVTVRPNGSIDFVADVGYDGPDSFRYRVCDTGIPTECDTATVSLTVAYRNHRPVAVDDLAATPEDVPVVIAVKGNDTDPDGDALSVSGFSQPKHGAVTRSGGQLVFTPDADWNGTTTFTYSVCDSRGACDEAVVTVTVDPRDDAPRAHDDAVMVRDGRPVTIPVTDNDDEVDGQPVTVHVVDQPKHGSVTVERDGDVVYTPDPHYSGDDSFTYQICDPDGDCSQATVTLEVVGTPAPPPVETPPPPADPGLLPHTGADNTIGRLALWGITLLLSGLVISRRSRSVGRGRVLAPTGRRR
jgi:VCBS repeat-containing protein